MKLNSKLAVSIAVGILVSLSSLAEAGDYGRKPTGNWLVGTWYLALDTTAFGLPPGLPLAGLAMFHRDGTYELQDAGDFGQATFLNTQNSNQFGAWRARRHGRAQGTALFLEADLATGEVLRWQKVELSLSRTDDRDVVTGIAVVSILECTNMLPVPTAFTCPDPVESADEFVIQPPFEIPVTFRRIRPGG